MGPVSRVRVRWNHVTCSREGILPVRVRVCHQSGSGKPRKTVPSPGWHPQASELQVSRRSDASPRARGCGHQKCCCRSAQSALWATALPASSSDCPGAGGGHYSPGTRSWVTAGDLSLVGTVRSPGPGTKEAKEHVVYSPQWRKPGTESHEAGARPAFSLLQRWLQDPLSLLLPCSSLPEVLGADGLTGSGSL